MNQNKRVGQTIVASFRDFATRLRAAQADDVIRRFVDTRRSACLDSGTPFGAAEYPSDRHWHGKKEDQRQT
jgi:hypothetical protein